MRATSDPLALLRRVAAEFRGSAALSAVVVGSGIGRIRLGRGRRPQSPSPMMSIRRGRTASTRGVTRNDARVPTALPGTSITSAPASRRQTTGSACPSRATSSISRGSGPEEDPSDAIDTVAPTGARTVA